MTQIVRMVITNCGDGSNSVEMFKTEAAIAKATVFADQGYEKYASGDGLQVHNLYFSDEFAVDAWVISNFGGYSDEEILDPDYTCY